MEKENNNIPTGLYWQGKRTEVERLSFTLSDLELLAVLLGNGIEGKDGIRRHWQRRYLIKDKSLRMNCECIK